MYNTINWGKLKTITNNQGCVVMTRLEWYLTIIILVCLVVFTKSVVSHKTMFQGKIPDPIQINLEDAKEIKHRGKKGEVIIHPKAKYEIEGVIKSKKSYLFFIFLSILGIYMLVR